MNVSKFIVVGENIHCTRIYKVGGKYCKETAEGFFIEYGAEGEIRQFPVPEAFMQSADWEAGKVKHCAAAIWQGNYGDDAAKAAAVDYLSYLAARQEASGATYLDVNVDEFSTDVEERVKLMAWTVDVVQRASTLPVSIDSSNTQILKAGLEACESSRARPMVNSVSLERTDAIPVAEEFRAVVIASAAGEKELPSNTEERMANLGLLIPKLTSAGLAISDIHIDPLVFPISVDGNNGNGFFEACRAIRETYGPEAHNVAGLSNISFGMPNRKLINLVFTYLCVQAGADGGIVDPLHINVDALNALDPETEGFKLAEALLTGKDDFGMNYIMASRDGTI